LLNLVRLWFYDLWVKLAAFYPTFDRCFILFNCLALALKDAFLLGCGVDVTASSQVRRVFYAVRLSMWAKLQVPRLVDPKNFQLINLLFLFTPDNQVLALFPHLKLLELICNSNLLDLLLVISFGHFTGLEVLKEAFLAVHLRHLFISRGPFLSHNNQIGFFPTTTPTTSFIEI
jgi:hypothetical protein